MGVRKYDIGTRNPDGSIFGIEIKSGGAKLRADEWLTAPMVEAAFLAFLEGVPLPDAIRWRDISAMFENLA